jgi:hypothetical protein
MRGGHHEGGRRVLLGVSRENHAWGGGVVGLFGGGGELGAGKGFGGDFFGFVGCGARGVEGLGGVLVGGEVGFGGMGGLGSSGVMEGSPASRVRAKAARNRRSLMETSVVFRQTHANLGTDATGLKIPPVWTTGS